MAGFPKYLNEIAGTFPSQKALADAIGITPQRLSRALQGDGNYSLNTDNGLRLARAANRPAVEVLRAAGKTEIAELLEHLFPRAGRPSITGAQRDLLDKWDSIPQGSRDPLMVLISELGEKATKRKTA